MNRTTAAGSSDAQPAVVFVFPFPPTIQFPRKFFIEELKARGFAVEYWDVGPLAGYRTELSGEAGRLAYLNVRTLRQLRAMLKAAGRRTVFVLQITRSLESFVIYLAFTLSRKTLVFFGRGYVPCSNPSRNGRPHYLRRALAAPSVGSLVVGATKSLFARNRLINKKYDLVFTAGRVAELIHAKDAKRRVAIRHFDVDAAIDDSSPRVLLPSNYCVFIDEYLPHHPDNVAVGTTGSMNAAKYFCTMNAFFRRVEEQYDTTVVIAAHPRAVYNPNPFDGRTVIVDATSHLVRRARLVFAHSSTAISYAVIHEKPLCLLVSEDLKKTHPEFLAAMLDTVAALGCPMLDWEAATGSGLSIPTVDLSKFRSYYANYLCSQTSLPASADIALAELTALLA